MSLDAQLDLSDEEFLKQDFSELEAQFDAEDTTEITDSTEELPSEESDNEEAFEASESTEEEPVTDTYEDEVDQPIEDTQEESETSDEMTDPESLDTDVTANENETDTEEDTQETDVVDFEGAYKRIMSPFKANGREMRIHNVEDAITLMQKGANYQKKMDSLKPNLKVIEMLNKEGLLEGSKINNLIDLAKKDPKAIAKLIQDSGIDPLDIDTDEEVDYKPTEHSISDKEFAINQAIDDIKDNPTFDTTLNIMGKKWDKKSRDIVAENPDIIGIIDTHVNAGVYGKVQGIIDQERALGRMSDIPDVIAYKQVAEYLQSNGVLFDEGQYTQTDVASVTKKTKANNEAKLKRKRKAAASTKKTSGKKTKAEKDYLKMSDDDFMKEAGQF